VKVSLLNTASGFGVVVLSNSSSIARGIWGVGDVVGVYEIAGEGVIEGVKVMVGETVRVGVRVIVGVRVNVGVGGKTRYIRGSA
jgi:hypothetical protein